MSFALSAKSDYTVDRRLRFFEEPLFWRKRPDERYDLLVCPERNVPHSSYATLAFVLLLASRSAFAADPTDPDGFKFENKLHQFGGLDPVECGIRPHQDAYPAAGCANDQLRMKHAFVMSYHYEWRDVSFYVGFAADSVGNLYQLEFERHYDYFFRILGLQNKGDQVGESYVDVRRCPRPTHIFVRPSANKEFFGLTCEQPESPGLPANATRERLE